jgi:4-carboxymuconolactone decarboxylase
MHSMTSEPTAVSRLPALHEPPQDPTVREIFGAIVARGSRILNIHRVVALAPKMIAAQIKYTTAMRQESSLPRPLQQLVILRTLQVNGASYELSVHRGATLALGVPEAKIDALASWRDSPLFDERERAMLAFAEQAAGSGEVDDAVFAMLARVLDPQGIVELATLVAWYVGNSRFTKALRIQPEPA